MKCAACGRPAEGNASIHRDGFAKGPEVELCDECGMAELPTCEEIWASIAARRAAPIQSLERRQEADARRKKDEGK